MMMPLLSGWRQGLAASVAFALGGCMFNVVSVKQTPTTFTALASQPRQVQLLLEVRASIGTGFTTWLKTGTSWKQVGTISEGDVLTTADQVVTVEASHIHEAYIVLRGDQLVGFYLPVEKTFAPVKTILPLKLKSLP